MKTTHPKYKSRFLSSFIFSNFDHDDDADEKTRRRREIRTWHDQVEEAQSSANREGIHTIIFQILFEIIEKVYLK